LEVWIAAGDETGGWDIVDGRFKTDFTGLAWVLGPVSIWERALQMPLGGSTALAAFSQPFSTRLPDGYHLPENSKKYHLKDIWGYCKKNGLNIDVALDVPQDDPILELLRSDAEWLLRQSGLGVLAVGGNAADGKAVGLGLSGDGLRERARAFAGLMTVAIPFLPGDASLNLLAEGRTEEAIADAAKYNLFSENVNDTRLFEPYRNFIGHLTEDLARASERCRPAVADATVVSQFSCKGRKGRDGMEALIGAQRGLPFLRAHTAEAVAAMNGIADLAAALMPRPDNRECRLVVPPDFSANLWSGNFRELRNAIHG
jgi:hypothetical protein